MPPLTHNPLSTSPAGIGSARIAAAQRVVMNPSPVTSQVFPVDAPPPGNDGAGSLRMGRPSTTLNPFNPSGLGFTLPTSTIAGAAGAGGGLVSGLVSAVPIVGSVLGPITQLINGLIGKAGAQKTAATKIVNDLEPQLAKNRDAYLSHPSPAMQQAALANFDAAWTWLTSAQGCGDPKLGAAGQRCISERQAGGSAPWCPTGTGCDWFALYRDPIANTAPTIEDNVQGGSGGSSTGTGTGAGSADILDTIKSSTVGGIPLWMILAGVAVLMFLPEGGDSGRRGR